MHRSDRSRTHAVPPLLLTPEQAADALGVGRTYVYALIRDQRLRSSSSPPTPPSQLDRLPSTPRKTTSPKHTLVSVDRGCAERLLLAASFPAAGTSLEAPAFLARSAAPVAVGLPMCVTWRFHTEDPSRWPPTSRSLAEPRTPSPTALPSNASQDGPADGANRVTSPNKNC
jgi:hypothetical protein